MNIASQKHDLRQAMKAILNELKSVGKRECGTMIRNHVAAWLDEVMPHAPLSIGLFSSLPEEISTHDLDAHLAQRGAQRAIACADSDSELHFYPLAKHERAESVSWQRPHDSDETKGLARLSLDIIFLPGLAFDLEGNRLGRGRGCFDRGLVELHARAQRPILVGLLFDEQLVSEVPFAEHDIAVDYLCTPKRGMIKIPSRVSHA